MIISQPISFYLLSVFLLVISVGVFVFLFLNHYSRKERVIGYLVPNKGIVSVYTPQEGILIDFNVSEGMEVRLNDELFSVLVDHKIKGEKSLSAHLLNELREQEQLLESKVRIERQRIEKEIELKETEYEKAKKDIIELDNLVQTQREIERLALKEYESHKILFEKKMTSGAVVDGAQKKYLEHKKQTTNYLLNLRNITASLKETRLYIDILSLNFEKTNNSARSELAEIAKQKAQIEAGRLFMVTAPIRGRVTSIVPTAGQRIGPIVPIFSIIPEDSKLEAHLYVPTRAIGFLKPGQRVKIRYDAFPYQRFGLFAAEINQVTKSILSPREIPITLPLNEPVYKVTASLDSEILIAYGEEVRLKPGMMLSADIVLAERSLFEWLFEPLYSLKGVI